MADHGGAAHHKRARRRAGLRSCLWAAAAALLGLAAGGLPIVRALEMVTLDTRFRMFAEPETARKDIVIVDINEESLRTLRDLPEYGRWPWGRGAHANLVEVLRVAGARLIVFDILFDMPEPKDPEGDAAFVRSVAKAGNVILAAAFPPDRLPSGYLDLARFALPASAAPEDPFVVRGALVPFKELRDVAAGIGAINIDPKGRRVPTTVSYEGGLYPSLALCAALAEGAELEPRVIRHQRGTTPLADNGEVLVTWRGPKGTYTYVEAEDVIRAYTMLLKGEDPPEWLETFRNKTVFVGASVAAAYEWR
ncbi:MAG: CHASE2 domain-containing protein, partial [Planctomycetota bacterium]|nr:CHASE2 domain-containing protein [Planctomycetota bacterium]